jgi:hypothetical protein
MKLTSATLVPLAFLMSSAFADESYQATAGGTLTLQIAPPKPAEAAAAPQAGETLTVHVVRPAAPDDSEDAEQRDLETCGANWNAKLKAYREELAQTKSYRTYWETWKDSPAQRPPKLPLLVLTRASYRQYIAQCLEGAGAISPGGWPDEKLQR